MINLTPSKGTHKVVFSDDNALLLDTYSTTSNPPITVVRNGNGEKIMELERSDISELKARNWQEPVEFSVKTRDEKTALYGIMCLPSKYDERKKYPVLNYIYPGPQSGSVVSMVLGLFGEIFKPLQNWGLWWLQLMQWELRCARNLFTMHITEIWVTMACRII